MCVVKDISIHDVVVEQNDIDIDRTGGIGVVGAKAGFYVEPIS